MVRTLACHARGREFEPHPDRQYEKMRTNVLIFLYRKIKGEFTITGKKEWIIPDGFMNNTKSGEFCSHEAVCVLNVSGKKASIKLTVYFEDREPLTGFETECENNRTKHIRLDKLKSKDGKSIPFGESYAILVESDEPIIVQHSRMDVSSSDMALMTTIAY